MNAMPLRVQEIVRRTCAEHGVDPVAVMGPRRLAKLVVARRACWRELRELRRPNGERFSYPQIGRWFGRDHSTVITGVQRSAPVLTGAKGEARSTGRNSSSQARSILRPALESEGRG